VNEGHADHAAQLACAGLVERCLIGVDRFNHRFLPRSIKPAVPGAGTECLQISHGLISAGYQSLGQYLLAGQSFGADRLIIDQRLIDSFVQSMRQAKMAEKALQKA